MRNMKFISSTDTSSLIEGYRRDSIHDNWRSFRIHVSNSIMVEVVDNFDETNLMEENKQKVTATAEPQKQAASPSAPKRGRGRPRKTQVAFNQLKGIEGDFTVKDVVQSNGLKEYEAHNKLRSALQAGEITVVKEITGGRGKPRKVYRLA